jgi:hypothetical protein
MLSLCLLVAAQADLGPIVPAGANRPFHDLVLAVEERLEEGDFAEAKRLVRLLPSQQIAIVWDESAVPQNRRLQFREGRDQALQMWRDVAMLEFKIVEPGSGPGDISVRFVDRLPPNADTAIPAGAVHFFSLDPADTRLETVLSLNRGEPQEPTQTLDIQGEVMYAVATYMGLERTHNPFAASGRTEMPYRNPSAPVATELGIIRSLLAAADRLRIAVKDEIRLTPARPALGLETRAVQLEPVTQGDPLRFSFQITNNGNAPLAIRLQPDCTCLVADHPRLIDPGTSALVQGAIDTVNFVGDLKKKFFIYSNDADFPLRELPVNVMVTPIYRMVAPAGTAVILDEERGGDAEAILYFPTTVKFQPQNVRVNGTKAQVSFEPWAGTVSDPEISEEPQTRSGYKFKVHFEPHGVPGRVPATLYVDTDDPRFPLLTFNFQTQKGIVALPNQVFLGEVPKEPRRMVFLLSQPQVPFKITKIESDSPYLTFSSRPMRGEWEHQVTVDFDGKADFGLFNSIIRVHTDHPRQPVIMVSVRGTIR